MELFTILLSALLGIISPVGIVSDSVAETAIRSRLDSAEDLEVRIDNAPSYQLVQGRIDRVRIAGRGLFPVEGVRIAVLEVETDPIAINPSSLRSGLQLDQPIQAGVRLVLNAADLDRALSSPRAAAFFRTVNLGAFGASSQGYQVVNPQVEFLPDQRLRLQATLQGEADDRLAIVLESGLSVLSGRQLQFVNPALSINGEAVPPELVAIFADGISRQFDLRNYERSGITARILKLEITPSALQVAAFVRVEPQAIPQGSRRNIGQRR